MSIEIKSNASEKTLQLYINGQLTKELRGEEASSFLLQAKKEAEVHGHLFKPQLETITVPFIETVMEGKIDQMIGLNIDLVKNMNANTGSIYAYIIKEGETDENRMFHTFRTLLENLPLEKNFKDEQFLYERFSNHDLRACLDEEVLNYIMDTPGFKIYVNDEEVNIYQFFDENETITFLPEENFHG